MGVGYGVAAALDIFGPDDQAVHPAPPETGTGTNRTAEATIKRFDGLQERLTRLEKAIDALTAPVDHPTGHGSPRSSEHFVTRAELSAAMERFAGTLDTDLQRRFDIQNRSVQSLRTMVARTDELLEQVLESIESVGTAA
jgi:hypothetical protein